MTSGDTSARRQITLRTIGLAILLVMALVAPVSAAPSAPSMWVGYVKITDIKDSSLVISWMTPTPTTGVARCFTTGGALVKETLDPIANTSTHYVVITGLTPNSQYLCEAESAGIVSVRYPVTTGPTPGPLPPGNEYVFGFIVKSDGATPAPNVIVYLRLHDANGIGSPGQSQWASARAEPTGVWSFNLLNFRTADASAYFTYTPGVDLLEIWIQGGQDGTWGYPPITENIGPMPGSFPAQLPLAVLELPPLAVTLADFTADSQAGGVHVSWQTSSEINNQGFHLYRAGDPAGPQTLLIYVPSQAPGSGQGASYQWLDTAVTAGETYYYWLEAVSVSGATTLFGPVSATYQAPTAVEVATFAAQPAGSATLAPWLLALPALLGAAAYGLRRRTQ